MSNSSLMKKRVKKCEPVLRRYGGDDDLFTGLVDLLADAMHVCDATANDFHYALALAGKHYLAELNDPQFFERRMP